MTSAGPVIYEESLDRDPRSTLSEGSRHFEQESAVFKAHRNCGKQLSMTILNSRADSQRRSDSRLPISGRRAILRQTNAYLSARS